MVEAQVSLEHLFRVFTKPEHKDSKLAQIEQHLSDNILDFLSQHVVTKKTPLERVKKTFPTRKFLNRQSLSLPMRKPC